MSTKYVSGRVKELKVGVSNYSESKESLSVVGIVSATKYYGDGSNLTGTSTPGIDPDASSDFTNINVAGVSTFAGNINANGNIVGDNSTNISGVSSVTATNYYGNGASLSGIEAAPTIQAVASGAIAANKAVKVNSDGTISVPTVTPPSFGSIGDVGYTFNTSGHKLTSHYNPITKKLVVVYVRSNFPKAMVGTVSGLSLIHI